MKIIISFQRSISFFFLILASGFTQAQQRVEMADSFRGEGKIYIVIAVILIILAGFFVLLFKLDRRTKRLEEEINRK